MIDGLSLMIVEYLNGIGTQNGEIKMEHISLSMKNNRIWYYAGSHQTSWQLVVIS